MIGFNLMYQTDSSLCISMVMTDPLSVTVYVSENGLLFDDTNIHDI